MGESNGMLSLRALNTITVTLALGLVALAGWHFQNPSHFELIQVSPHRWRPFVLSVSVVAKRCCHKASCVATATRLLQGWVLWH